MAAGCPFITCAIKNHALEFCWNCPEQTPCAKWRTHRETGKIRDSFKCYQKLEANIAFIQTHGVTEFVKQQRIREQLLMEMLRDFNEGRSKRYYCIAATVFPINELRHLIQAGNEQSRGLPIKQKSHVLHSLLDEVAKRKNYRLKLRK
jgi:hypothetical protein